MSSALKCCLGVGDDPDGHRVIHADLLGVEVDLDQRFRNRHAPPVGEDLGKAAADGEHDIGVRQRQASADRPPMTERQGIALVDQALRIERGDDRCAQSRGQGFDLVGRSGPECTSAGQNDRALRSGQNLRRPRDRIERNGRLGARRKRRQIGRRRALQTHHVLRKEQRGWTRTAPGHRLERLAEQCRNLPGPARRTTPIRHRPEDSLEIDLVIIATLAIERVGVDLTREQEDRDRVGPAFGDSRQRIGRAGAGRRADDSRPARDPRVAIRGEGAGLLVADQDRANGARSADRVVNRRRVRARHPEQIAHSMTSQSVHQYVRPVLHDLPAPLKTDFG